MIQVINSDRLVITHRADKSKHFKDVCQLSMLVMSNIKYDPIIVPEKIRKRL